MEQSDPATGEEFWGGRLGMLGHRHDDETRSFLLRQIFQLSADSLPNPEAGTLHVRLHGMGNWHCSNRVLAELCHFLNAHDTHYPRTELRLVLEAPASEQ